jgi:hypothetical protein
MMKTTSQGSTKKNLMGTRVEGMNGIKLFRSRCQFFCLSDGDNPSGFVIVYRHINRILLVTMVEMQ